MEESVHHLEITECSSDEEMVEIESDQLVDCDEETYHMYLDPIVGAKISPDSVHVPTGSETNLWVGEGPATATFSVRDLKISRIWRFERDLMRF